MGELGVMGVIGGMGERGLLFGKVTADVSQGGEEAGGELAAGHHVHLEAELLKKLRVMAAHCVCLFQAQSPDCV